MTDQRVHPDSGTPYQAVPRATNPHAKVHDLALLEFAGPDTKTATTFFTSFGLQCREQQDGSLEFSAAAGAPAAVLYRPARQAKFIGPTFAVATVEELARLAEKAGAAPPAPLAIPGAPPGVVLTDPNGVTVKVGYFETWRALPHCDAPPATNRGDDKPRINATRRPPRVPSRVLRLGHMVLGTPDWEATARFYIDTLGLIPSDVQALPDGRPAVAFLRCDRGDRPTDHHTFVVARLPVVDFEHAAFEVADLDEVGMGGQILQEGGFRRAWGIGRHILGSQIFDYWFGPDGRKFEHFADGDLFDAARPTRYHPMSVAGLSQWGPPVPSAFLRPRLGWHEVKQLVRNLLGKSNFGFRELRLLSGAMRSSSLPD
jgi:catechol 2,3-dioxygenase-like lactoylglutathione lyase family enzyme